MTSSILVGNLVCWSTTKPVTMADNRDAITESENSISMQTPRLSSRDGVSWITSSTVPIRDNLGMNSKCVNKDYTAKPTLRILRTNRSSPFGGLANNWGLVWHPKTYSTSPNIPHTGSAPNITLIL
ncbi:uncharacterized protein LOC144448601 [Glandiceps talaboti]